MGEQVSAEAVEAAAEALHGIDCGCKTGPDPAYRAQAEAALTAALPYLAAHQPARVVPSAEELETDLADLADWAQTGHTVAYDDETETTGECVDDCPGCAAERIIAALTPTDARGGE